MREFGGLTIADGRNIRWGTLGLALVEVLLEEIAKDYDPSADPWRAELLRQRQNSSHHVILEPYLQGAGVSQLEIDAAEARFLEPSSPQF